MARARVLIASAASAAPDGVTGTTPAAAPARAFGRPLPRWAVPATVGAVTVLALVLRLLGLHESLFGDEIFTYDIVTRNDLGSVLSTVRHTSITPPLHYVVAWFAVQIGNPHTWVRVPSIIFGTLTVPMLYLLGARTVGRSAGVLAALLLAISPFAVWYGEEARTYALVMLLVVCAAYAVVRARDAARKAWRWWLAFALAAGGAMYSHYTALFVLAAIAVWAGVVFGRRGRLAEPFMAVGATIILYVPWIPSYLDQHANPGLRALEVLSKVTVRTAWEYPAIMVFGQPFAGPWDALLGTAGRVLLAASLIAFLVAAVVGRAGLLAQAREHIEGLGLIALCAVATPLGLLAYALLSSSLYLPRNLSASLPSLLLLVGAAIMWTARNIRWAAAACLVAALTVALVAGYGDDRRRPPTEQVARAIDGLAKRTDPVLLADLAIRGDVLGRHPLFDSYTTYLRKPHDRLAAAHPGTADFERFVAATSAGQRLFYIVPSYPGFGPRPPDQIDLTRFRIVSQQVFDGMAPITLYVLAPRDRRTPRLPSPGT